MKQIKIYFFGRRESGFKIGDIVRISKYKFFFAKSYTPNWSEQDFVIKKVKNTVPWTYVINDLNGGKIVEIFSENKLQKTNKKEFRMEKVIKRKCDKFYVKWKGYDSSFKVGLIKKMYYKLMNIFPKPNYLGANVKVELDLPNYTTKTDFKNATGVDTSSFAKKTDLANLKSDVDKLDIGKLKNVTRGLCNLKSR